MNNILVVKLGGGEGLDLAAACDDLAQIARVRPVVIVHGVSGRMAELCRARGVEQEMLISPTGHSSRYTPPHIRDLYVEAARDANREIVELLRLRGISAVSMADVPGGVLHGERKTAVRALSNGRVRLIRDDYSGTIQQVNALAVRQALEAGHVPVIPPMADSPDGLLNVDGDRASAAVAAVLRVAELVILSNVRGLLRDTANPDSVIDRLDARQIDEAMGLAQGRMKRKILGVQEAISGGVARVVIGDGRVGQPVSRALHGAGTEFVR